MNLLVSPLAGTTDRQAEALLEALNKEQDDVNFKLYLGLNIYLHILKKQQMHNDGIKEAVTVVLAPHYSSFSVGSYDQRAQEKADEYGIQLTHIKHYYQQPKFIKYWTEKLMKH